ncbi:hypothetical protein [Flexithrix dorotheae]|uniref:hypothetical protein n=1 Tax=Flexithrix dorotheae TaxID=70993 RepID=UPI000371CD91|nr:hypothetical protein [Flexithrix dorotheae]
MTRKVLLGILFLFYLLRCTSLVYGYLDGYFWESLNLSGFTENFQKHVNYGLIEIMVMLFGALGFLGYSHFSWILLSLYAYLVVGVGIIFLFGFNQIHMNYQLSHLIFADILLIILNIPPLIKGYKIYDIKHQLSVNLIGLFCGVALAFLFY